ncbi:MAG: hypothetical protein U0228_21975 [Myxococcaceae bacterium]
MTQQPPAPPFDARLSSLLEFEQQLESRFRAAEVEAHAALEAARATLARARQEGLREAEGLAAEHDRAELATHQAALEAIEVERRAALARLEALEESAIDRLARRVLERVIAPPTGGAP